LWNHTRLKADSFSYLDENRKVHFSNFQSEW
jgi:hypothetical protein